MNKSNLLRFANTNARSLTNKIASAVDNFNERDLAFMIVTETWMMNNAALRTLETDLRHRDAIDILSRSRKSKNGRNPGGGVAILFKKNLVNLKEFKIRTDGFELLVAKGKIKNDTRPVFVMAVYLPPSLNARSAAKVMETIADAILKIKGDSNSPHIIIGGDINGFDLSLSISDYSDIRILDSPPTRGTSRLDLVATTIPNCMVTVVPPLVSDAGCASDHSIVVVETKIVHTHQFTYNKFYTRDINTQSRAEFSRDFNSIDWEQKIGRIESPTEMTEVLHQIIEDLKEKHFPLTLRKNKSTDPPWITDQVRRKIRQRKRAYGKKMRRDTKWAALKKESNDLIKRNKTNFFKQATDKLKSNGSSQLPYRALRELAIPERPDPWSINMLAPDLTDEQLAEDLATYFSRITDQFTPLDTSRIRQTFSSPFPLFTHSDIADRIRASKKPKSPVTGDLMPVTVNENVNALAIPATRIVNYALQSREWPRPWRLETQSGIPKSSTCDSFDQIRNLSCTNILSKVLEAIVLERLQSEIAIRQNQYGGVRGSGTNHFLIETWNKILSSLESGTSAVAIMSIDFSKAFNRLCHNDCIEALMRRGASSENIQMVAAFLSERSMMFKVNTTYSAPRPVRGGSPQGTKLGNFLFVIAIEEIELRRLSVSPPPQVAGPHEEEEDDFFGLRNLAGRIGAVRRFDSGVRVASTPNKSRTTDGVLRYFDESGRSDASVILDPPIGEPGPVWSDKYVDDLNVGEELSLDAGICHLSSKKEVRKLRAVGCEEVYGTVEENANSKGMLVNEAKTQLICISPSLNYDVSTYLELPGGTRIESGNELTILGFSFGTKPDVSAHVGLILKKYAARSWMIRHLKNGGVDEKTLVAVYSSVIRSVIEYAVPVYHHMLTGEQSERLERLQRQTLKMVYGFDVSYSEALRRSGLTTLAERRAEIVRKFVVKVSNNERYDRWFPLLEAAPYNLRTRRRYEEFYARTERMLNNPLNRMRKLLNSM